MPLTLDLVAFICLVVLYDTFSARSGAGPERETDRGRERVCVKSDETVTGDILTSERV